MPQAADLVGREDNCVYALEAVAAVYPQAPREAADARACTVDVQDLPRLEVDRPNCHGS